MKGLSLSLSHVLSLSLTKLSDWCVLVYGDAGSLPPRDAVLTRLNLQEATERTEELHRGSADTHEGRHTGLFDCSTFI